jgi:PQQ-dependent dehydrogenase (methanol/ethanol family)
VSSSIFGVALALALGAASVAFGASPAADPADWPAYNRTLAGDRFSPLTEIDRANVSRLRRLCEYTLPEVTSFQTGPIVVDGVMYFTTDESSYAIDASDCRLNWRRYRRSATPNALHVNRGFAYLDGRLFRGTSDGHVLALDAASGRVIWDRAIPAHGPGVSIPMAPIAANGRVYVGNAGGDNVGITGHVYAYDARDGRLLWSFDVVPHGKARASWTDPRLPVTGGAFWTSFTLDRAKGILYVPAGNPAPDFDALERTGANLYSDSVIALDASTGRMLAYRQLVERDEHDWDVNSPPTLVTTRSGREIIASANKDGLLSILDRSGLSRALGNAPQPVVIPLLSQTPTTTRLNVNVPLSRDFTVHFCPGFQGGVEWNGAAYSPPTDSLFVAAVDWCANVKLVRKLEVPKTGTLWFGAADSATGLFDPQDRARGWVSAFDAETGKVRWRFEAPHPMLAGVTPTAAGIVFVADLGGTIYALDQESGRVLWRTSTGEAMGGGIVAYSVHGRERVAVAAGMKSPIWPGSADKSRILVYGLR